VPKARVSQARLTNICKGESKMGESEQHTSQPDSDGNENERIPAMQRLLDNPFLLLFLGVVMPTVLYVIWGVMEIISIPIAK